MLARRHGHWVRAAVVVWAALLLGLAIFGYRYPWSHTVYDIYAQAGRNWWTGHDLYVAEGTAYFRYSPLFAVGLTPFSVFSDSWGNALWRIFNGLVCAAGIGAWTRKVLPPSLSSSQRAAHFLLVLPLAMHSLYNGQANLLMLGALLLGLAAAAENHWNRAAVWLALATLVKGYPLALALLLAVLYFRQFALRFAAALAVGLLLPFATQRPVIVISQYRSWFAHLHDSTIIMRERLRSLDHLFALTGHELTPRTWLLIQLFSGLVVPALCLLHARHCTDAKQRLNNTFLLFSIWAILFGPATESCTYAVAGPALAWALVEAAEGPARWRRQGLLIVSLFLMGPCATDLVGSTIRNFANAHGSQPIGALLFLGYLLVRQKVAQVGLSRLALGVAHLAGQQGVPSTEYGVLGTRYSLLPRKQATPLTPFPEFPSGQGAS
jgi:hypothetical protein